MTKRGIKAFASHAQHFVPLNRADASRPAPGPPGRMAFGISMRI
jgi:hypothetical protein